VCTDYVYFVNAAPVVIGLIAFIFGRMIGHDVWLVILSHHFDSIFSHGGHLGYRTVLTDTILKGDHPRFISAKFG
jgi:hypothetical protein